MLCWLPNKGSLSVGWVLLPVCLHPRASTLVQCCILWIGSPDLPDWVASSCTNPKPTTLLLLHHHQPIPSLRHLCSRLLPCSLPAPGIQPPSPLLAAPRESPLVHSACFHTQPRLLQPQHSCTCCSHRLKPLSLELC